MDRIDLIASLAKDSKCVVDVGCDHAYAAIRAVKYYNCESAIASDINIEPLNNAKKTIYENHLQDKIKTQLSDGLKEIIDDFDTVIISGMGGNLIVKILEDSYNKIYGKKLIIEANKDSYLVRKFLTDRGFMISKEYAIMDNDKYYEIIVFMNGICDYTEKEIKYGPMLLANKPEAFINHYKNILETLNNNVDLINDEKKKNDMKSNINEINNIVGISFEKEYILNTKCYYRTYFIDDEARPTIVISAGGGYQYTSPREEEPVMKKYHEAGYNVVIVNYRETKEFYPKPQEYLAYVIGLLQEDYRVSKIIGLGFSAGAHCMLEVNCHNDNYNIRRCDLLMLSYPVITTNSKYYHEGSFKNLLGDKFNDKDMMEYLSLEKQIDSNMPDLFLWHTFTDESVNIYNSLLLLEAYKNNNLNAEFHIFPLGGHGLSVSNSESAQGNNEKNIPYVADWVSYSLKWLEYKLK